MHKFKNHFLPPIFNSLFTQVNTVHTYNTRHSNKESYYLPKARTNYGLFNIRYQGPKIWNLLEQETKSLSISTFKDKIKNNFLIKY